jgi:uncharacterized protein with von Willebrand factor type A (vWA) domain
MQIRYACWQGDPRRNPGFLRALLGLYHTLLLQTNGDVGEALRWLERAGRPYGLFTDRYTIEDFARFLEEQGAIENTPDGARLTPRGGRAIRRDSLDRVFGALRAGLAGDHRGPGVGSQGEPLPETRPFAFGDRWQDLDVQASLRNAIRRSGPGGIELGEEDLEVHESERLSSCATVLLLDISHSMVLYGEDRITPAKRVALALVELILTRYPKDDLDVVLFGDEARQIPLIEIPFAEVGPYHTNTKAGLRLAQQILARKKHANKQIFMITDGKPSAFFERGRLYRNPVGLDEKIVNRTLEEAAICRRKRIPITTFMVADDPLLRRFVMKFTEVNRGRAYYSDLDRLGTFVLVDFVRNRRGRAT